jgi:RNA-directed DNA polymerase
MKKSRAVKVLAVHRVCKVNTGRHTAGVDGVSIPKDIEGRLPMMMELFNDIDIEKKPQPIKRVYIPKPNGDKRPLGIPTIADRINQDIIRQAVEPICEFHFQSCSYGFRPKRSCQDAMSDLFNKLSKKHGKRWIVEGDIKGCFDHIKHSHIISTLSQWQVPTPITTIIEGFLKADIMEESRTTPSSEGTPQGGIISPMLANVALTCLNEEILSQYGRRYITKSPQNPIVRYADDFVIVARNETEANSIKDHIKGFLREKVGLTLSDEKTRISEISNGFDFLGFNFRKYGQKDKLLIMPTKESIKQVKWKLSKTFRKYRNNEPDVLIRNLIPIITGWSNYYRHVVSKQIFSAIDTHIWTLTKQWIKKRHPLQGTDFWTQRYFTRARGNRWIFFDHKTNIILPKMNWTRIKRFIKVKHDMRVNDVNARRYWEKREYLNAKDAIMGLGELIKTYNEQKGKCAYCKKSITEQQVKDHSIHTHHMSPRSNGGGRWLRNLRLLHSECHNLLHGTFSRQEMADLINKGIDYLRLMKPAMR